MIVEGQIEYRRFLERHASYDARTPSGHVKLVTDAVMVHKFGGGQATVWLSFADRGSILVGAVENVTYHSDAVKAGGWVNIVAQTLEGAHHLRSFTTEDLIAVSICYDVINEDLDQFRVVQTFTRQTFSSAYCTADGWDWTWIEHPRSKTADLIKQVIFGGETTKEESHGS